ncbi:MAG: NAD(P)/FAD-dependent oxidoreductase [Alphaproteobacteria bacterium]
MTKNIVIIGAGPSGLAAAYEVTGQGEKATVLEASGAVGGLARTMAFDGCLFDVGPHRFFTGNKEVIKLFDDVVADDTLHVKRLTRIYYKGKYFNYPLSPVNALLGMGIFNSVATLVSYAKARLRHRLAPFEPKNFEEWITNQFGERLYRTFFKTYTEKVWGIACTEISSQWAAQRIKSLNLIQAILNALFGARKKVIKTLVDEFVFPKLGAGQLYEKMAATIETRGGTIALNSPAHKIIHKDGRISAVVTAGGEEQSIEGDYFLGSAPLTQLLEMMDPPPPDNVLAASRSLRYRDHIGVQLKMRGIPFPDNWIYIHSPDIRMARIANYRNFSPFMADGDDISPITVEYFTFKDDDIWSLSDDELIQLAVREMETMGTARPEFISGFVVRSEKAYPVIDQDSEAKVDVIRDWIGRFENFLPIGRSGMFKYNNQDHAIATGLLAARTALGTGDYDPWNVNIDAEYHESSAALSEDED